MFPMMAATTLWLRRGRNVSTQGSLADSATARLEDAIPLGFGSYQESLPSIGSASLCLRDVISVFALVVETSLRCFQTLSRMPFEVPDTVGQTSEVVIRPKLIGP